MAKVRLSRRRANGHPVWTLVGYIRANDWTMGVVCVVEARTPERAAEVLNQQPLPFHGTLTIFGTFSGDLVNVHGKPPATLHLVDKE